MLIIGPSLHYWFSLVLRVYPKYDLLLTFKKMVLGQVVYGPIVTTIFFFVNASFTSESGSEVIGRLKRDLIPTLASSDMYWPVCDFFHLQMRYSFSFFLVPSTPILSI
ncbi:pxmp2/4 family protein 4 [Phtheirospermum japonicum]|uniref:Pxmp2/4 family protein 4 n=1 Tax=Phtheirospermum japonicum TaxID=374723 RepID=A0A830CET8_9LAMI|nr:pxmp2/4 family protein 4 [Phtheirospermum japonicum]